MNRPALPYVGIALFVALLSWMAVDLSAAVLDIVTLPLRELWSAGGVVLATAATVVAAIDAMRRMEASGR